MPFTSLLFLCGFLPVFLTIYFLVPSRYRNGVALAGSLAFYTWGEPRFMLVLLVVSVLDFLVSFKIAQLEPGSGARRAWITAAISLNLCVLFYYKYAEFLFKNVGHPLGFHILLPLGVSFVVFEEISYLVDVYRTTTLPARKYTDYALFLFLFPHSISGPIFRWRDMEHQFSKREHSAEKRASGVLRFILGLAKKVLIADPFGRTADLVFGAALPSLTTRWAWAGVIAYSIQIYFDFSGYSDMAIGLGRIMGFDFLENFNGPYFATSMTDFWHRWHISLSRWMRDYLYIPLGGNRLGTWRTYLNLIVVFFLVGMWHGANFTFAAWGLYHGFFLVLERLREKKPLPLWPLMRRIYTLLVVIMGWVLFRAQTITQAWGLLKRMWGWTSPQAPSVLALGELLSVRMQALLVVLAVVYLLGCEEQLKRFAGWVSARAYWRWGLALAAVYLSISRLANAIYSPFLYFRF